MTTAALLAGAVWMLWVCWEVRQLKLAVVALRAALNAANHAAEADAEKLNFFSREVMKVAQLESLTDRRLELLRYAFVKDEPLSDCGNWEDP